MSQTSLSFHNTLGLSGGELNTAEKKAHNQESLILDFFKRRAQYNSYTPAEIWQVFNGQGYNWPLTSVRRSISNLTDKKKVLIKLNEKRRGIFGLTNHTWKLKL